MSLSPSFCLFLFLQLSPSVSFSFCHFLFMSLCVTCSFCLFLSISILLSLFLYRWIQSLSLNAQIHPWEDNDWYNRRGKITINHPIDCVTKPLPLGPAVPWLWALTSLQVSSASAQIHPGQYKHPPLYAFAGIHCAVHIYDPELHIRFGRFLGN